ncbi:hypothetical protein HDV00_006998 [Rhizophlyctis rosea]|nr:hypothetical protein HDV00_006998 [Rhizophlyctis rosea]
MATAVDTTERASTIDRDGPHRIAVVDDNPINRLILVRLLKKHFDHDVAAEDVFEDGWECLKGLSSRRFDLLLLDIEMPVCDGVKTAMHVRTNSAPDTHESHPLPEPLNILPHNATVPIVAVTSNTLPHQKEEYLRIGMEYVVGKPIKQPEVLIAIVESLVPGLRRVGLEECKEGGSSSEDTQQASAEGSASTDEEEVEFQPHPDVLSSDAPGSVLDHDSDSTQQQSTSSRPSFPSRAWTTPSVPTFSSHDQHPSVTTPASPSVDPEIASAQVSATAGPHPPPTFSQILQRAKVQHPRQPVRRDSAFTPSPGTSPPASTAAGPSGRTSTEVSASSQSAASRISWSSEGDRGRGSWRRPGGQREVVEEDSEGWREMARKGKGKVQGRWRPNHLRAASLSHFSNRPATDVSGPQLYRHSHVPSHGHSTPHDHRHSLPVSHHPSHTSAPHTRSPSSSHHTATHPTPTASQQPDNKPSHTPRPIPSRTRSFADVVAAGIRKAASSFVPAAAER